VVSAFQGLQQLKISASSAVLPQAFLGRRSSDQSYFPHAKPRIIRSALSHFQRPKNKPKLVVSFSDVVVVRETYSQDEYPGRSRLATDTSEDKDQALRVKTEVEETSRVLGLMMRRGVALTEMPDLKKNW
jgi:hypothetical protein